MKSEPLIYLRRSTSDSEISLKGQFDAIVAHARRFRILLDVNGRDFDYMEAMGLSVYKSIYIGRTPNAGSSEE